jgi:hypothetical protein
MRGPGIKNRIVKAYVPILEGPYQERTIGEIVIELYCKPGHRDKIDLKHWNRALRAAGGIPKDAPNPCLVPLDNERSPEGGPWVFARIYDKSRPDQTFGPNLEVLREPIKREE